MEADPTTHALAPAAEPENQLAAGESDGTVSRAVKQVAGGGPMQHGDAVQFEFALVDASRERFHASHHDFLKIVSDLRGLASVAERDRRSTSSRPAERVNPYQATGSRADRVGSMIVIRFPTADGVPLLVALEESACENLQRELDRALDRPPRDPAY